jgi:membrane-bound ClpP family serine protease
MNRIVSLLLLFLGVMLLVVPPSLAQEHGPIVLVNITDEIDQTTQDTFANALAYARQQQAQAVIMV